MGGLIPLSIKYKLFNEHLIVLAGLNCSYEDLYYRSNGVIWSYPAYEEIYNERYEERCDQRYGINGHEETIGRYKENLELKRFRVGSQAGFEYSVNRLCYTATFYASNITGYIFYSVAVGLKYHFTKNNN